MKGKKEIRCETCENSVKQIINGYTICISYKKSLI